MSHDSAPNHVEAGDVHAPSATRSVVETVTVWSYGSRRAIAAGALVLFAATVSMHAISCGPGNTGQTPPDAQLSLEVPWLNGVLPALDDSGAPLLPLLPIYPPIASGLADPGSGPARCDTFNSVDTSPYWVETFEPDDPNDPTQVGVGAAWAAFDDSSTDSFRMPGDATWYTGLDGKYGAPWGVPGDTVGGPSCDGKPNRYSLHFRGGLWRKWGGGVSHVFTDPEGCPVGADFCPPDPPKGATVDSQGLPLTAPDGGAYAQSHAYIDVSSYDGVSFWARRGPEGQSRMIVTVTDIFTSDRLAKENQKFCRRLSPTSTGSVCHSVCSSGVPCVPDDPKATTPVYRCMDPRGNQLPANTSLADFIYPRCGPSACSSPDTSPDPDFDGKQCRPHTFPAADESGEYCFNEGDPDPPNRDERCFDGWASTVELSLDWQYYTVAFSDMRQGGYGKMAPYFDLHAVDTLAFNFIVGWADAYLDDVTFYRNKK